MSQPFVLLLLAFTLCFRGDGALAMMSEELGGETEDKAKNALRTSALNHRRRLQRLCKEDKQRCKRSSRCCPGLSCQPVRRVVNKQGATKIQRRCVGPNFDGATIGLRKACGEPLKKCHRNSIAGPPPGIVLKGAAVCCPSLRCAPVKRIVNRQGDAVFESRCIDPGKPKPVIRPRKFQRWTMQELLENSDAFPFAIGRGGNGATEFGFREGKEPHQNSAPAVEHGFRGGMRVVQVMTRLTKDGVAVAELHDRHVLPNSEGPVCTSMLSLDELRSFRPHIDRLETVLRAARKFSFKREYPDEPSGLVLIHFHDGSPKCDADNTLDEKHVQAVLMSIEDSDMAEQVQIQAFSPVTLQQIKRLMPNLPLSLGARALQLLPVPVVEQILQVTLVSIQVEEDSGLEWYELELPSGAGGARLPMYSDGAAQYLSTAAAVGAGTVSMESDILAQQQATQLFAAIDELGLVVITWVFADADHTPIDEAMWDRLVSFGADGIMISDIALGKQKQAPWM